MITGRNGIAVLISMILFFIYFQAHTVKSAEFCSGPYMTNKDLRDIFPGGMFYEGVALPSKKRWKEFLAKDGSTYLLKSNNTVVKGKWKLENRKICFSYGKKTFRCQLVAWDRCGKVGALYAFAKPTGSGNIITSIVDHNEGFDRFKLQARYQKQEKRKAARRRSVEIARGGGRSGEIVSVRAHGRLLSDKRICKMHMPSSFLNNRRFFRKPIKKSDISYLHWHYTCADDKTVEGDSRLSIHLKKSYGRSLGLSDTRLRFNLSGQVTNMKFEGRVKFRFDHSFYDKLTENDINKLITPGYLEKGKDVGYIYAHRNIFVRNRSELAEAKSVKSPLIDRLDIDLKMKTEMDGRVRHINKGMVLESFAAISNAFVKYNVKPKPGQLKYLTANRYRIIIGIDMQNTFVVGTSFVTTTKTEETKNEFELVLKKTDGYRLSGSHKLKSIIASNSGRVLLFDVRKKLVKSEPAVYVKKVLAE